MTKDKLALGVDLGGTNIKVAAVDFRGRIFAETKVNTKADQGQEAVFKQIKKGIDEIFFRCADTKRFIGVGIGAAGMVNAEEGTVNYPPNFPGWEVVQVRDRVQAEVGLPTFIDNDANVAALGEGAFGAGMGYNDFFLITLGTGVGGGLFLGGKIYHGMDGAAGEFGHTVVKFDGPQCLCGNYGCLERFVGAEYIKERALRKLEKSQATSILCNMAKDNPQSITPKAISEAARKGDALSLEVLRETGEIIGAALSSVVNLLNLPLIIIGGGIAQAGNLLFKPIEESLGKRALPIPRIRVKVVGTRLGEWAGVIGAATLAMNVRSAVGGEDVK